MKDKRQANNSCPSCNKKLDHSTHGKGIDRLPEPEDISICICCLCFLEYQDDLSLKEISEIKLMSYGMYIYKEMMRIKSTIISVKTIYNKKN